MRILLIVILSAFGLMAVAQSIPFGNKSRICLVSHDEKQAGPDPLLTADGNNRAGDLMRGMKDKPIRHIYINEYKRTQNTGDGLRIQLGIDAVHYQSELPVPACCKKLSGKVI